MKQWALPAFWAPVHGGWVKQERNVSEMGEFRKEGNEVRNTGGRLGSPAWRSEFFPASDSHQNTLLESVNEPNGCNGH